MKHLAASHSAASKEKRTHEEAHATASRIFCGALDNASDFLYISSNQCKAPAPKCTGVTTWLTGSVCGVKLSEIDVPLMLELHCLDEPAKGKPMEKILRK